MREFQLANEKVPIPLLLGTAMGMPRYQVLAIFNDAILFISY